MNVKSPFLDPPESPEPIMTVATSEARARALYALLEEALSYQRDTFECGGMINGGDLCDFFCDWRKRVSMLLEPKPKKKPKKEKATKKRLFLNYYECPDCKRKWTEEWDATCDTTCPRCAGRNISPYKSEDA